MLNSDKKILTHRMDDKFYDLYWRNRGKSKPRSRYHIFLSWVEPESKILDVGGGDGTLAQFLRDKKGCNVVCVDISKEALKMANKKGLATRNLDATKPLPFDKDEFDYIIASEFIEHIPNSEEIVNEAMRVARKALLISCPNSAYWKYRASLLLGRSPKQWDQHPAEHLRFWSIKDFLEWIDALGFVVEEYKSSNGRRYLRDIFPNLFGLQICYKIIRK